MWHYLERYQSYRAGEISILKISKGNNSTKNVGGVAVVNLCTSSDHALYLCQFSWNYLERYQSYGADTNDQPLTDGRTDTRTDTQKFGGYNIIPRHFLWRGIIIDGEKIILLYATFIYTSSQCQKCLQISIVWAESGSLAVLFNFVTFKIVYGNSLYQQFWGACNLYLFITDDLDLFHILIK